MQIDDRDLIHPFESPATQSKSARIRRRWSVDEKTSIVKESSQSGMSVSAVAKKHGIPTNLLFQWRRQFEMGGLAVHYGGRCSDGSEHDLLTQTERLARLQNMVVTKLAEEIRRNQITSYNASIALSNLTTGLAKLSALTLDLRDRIGALEPSVSTAATPQEISSEEQRMAEILCLQLVREELRREKELETAGEDDA
jgi:transposase-like protein